MKTAKKRIIFDTNVWISFLIGKRLFSLRNLLIHEIITLIITEQLLKEIDSVTQREKFRKYFSPEKVADLILLLETVAEKFEIKPTVYFEPDPKDSFLLDLIAFSKADYLVTGDKALLELGVYKTAMIITPGDFELFKWEME